ncbi:hypothetical protein VTK73DRAFT_2923 [Phialemonium thermophilum]|uniref:Secreted protein n=1 Tax=Phialemonium thermophilum TaxID=223376 RepID=A0ABR3X219_9PEZI
MIVMVISPFGRGGFVLSLSQLCSCFHFPHKWPSFRVRWMERSEPAVRGGAVCCGSKLGVAHVSRLFMIGQDNSSRQVRPATPCSHSGSTQGHLPTLPSSAYERHSDPADERARNMRPYHIFCT